MVVMKFAIAGEHRRFFQTHHYLEVEDLLSPDQVQQCNIAVDAVLAERLKVHPQKIAHYSAVDQLFVCGRDLWRSSDTLKKVITKQQLSEIAYELFDVKPLRLGYDQLYPEVQSRSVFANANTQIDTLFDKASVFESTCSIQGALGGVMLCLSDNTAGSETAAAEQTVFSQKVGHGVFFNSKATIDYPSLLQRQGQRFLLLVYTHPTSVYVPKDQDPLFYSFKNVGYSFGDRLNDKVNPIIYR